MTETEKKALALVNEACKSDFKDLGSTYRNNLLDALCRAIEQHEAFRQEVSAMLIDEYGEEFCRDHSRFERFIIPKPDPLVDALLETFPRANGAEGMAADLRAALAARGLEIREKQP